MNESCSEALCEGPEYPTADDSGLKLSLLRKKLVRRSGPDRSQVLRRSFQLAFLLLAVPGRNALRISLARRREVLRPEFSAAALARPSSPQSEISAAGIFCMGCCKYVPGRDFSIHA